MHTCRYPLLTSLIDLSDTSSLLCWSEESIEAAVRWEEVDMFGGYMEGRSAVSCSDLLLRLTRQQSRVGIL